MRNYFLRRFRSTSNKEEDEKKERTPFWPWLWKAVKSGLSGTIAKWVGVVLTFIVVSVGGWLINNTYIDPIQAREVRGQVFEADSGEKPLPGATVYVSGQKGVEFEAGADGVFSGKVKVRKSTKQLILSCDLEGYRFYQKPVDIPVDKGEPIITKFHLTPL